MVMIVSMTFCFIASSEPNPQKVISQNKTDNLSEQKLTEQKTPAQELIDAISRAIQIIADKAKPTQHHSTPDNSTRLFALLLVIFTGGLVVVGGVQCYIIFKTLKETAIAAKAAQDSTAIIPAIERAYLFVKVSLNTVNNIPGEIIKIGTKDEPAWNIAEIIVTNHGKTPAILMNVGILTNSIGDIHGGAVINHVLTCAKDSFDVYIIPGAELIDGGCHRIFNSYFSVTNIEWQKLSESNRLVSWGFIKYKDVFGNSHETAFCWQWQDLINNFYPDKEDHERNYQT